jgi:hypothetical protein
LVTKGDLYIICLNLYVGLVIVYICFILWSFLCLHRAFIKWLMTCSLSKGYNHFWIFGTWINNTFNPIVLCDEFQLSRFSLVPTTTIFIFITYFYVLLEHVLTSVGLHQVLYTHTHTYIYISVTYGGSIYNANFCVCVCVCVRV